MRWFRVLLWPAGAAFGLAAEWVSFGWGDPRHWVPDLVTGWTLIACGLVAWSRRPESRSGVLMAATGFSWFLGNFANTDVGLVDWVGAHALYVYRGPLIHLLVTYPSGRISSRVDRAAVGVGYAVALVTPVWRSEIATIVLAALLVGVCARSYLRAVGPARRARLLALQTGAGLGLVLAGGAAARLAVPAGDADELSLLALEATLCALAGVLLVGLLSPSWGRAGVTDLVVELGESRSGTLREELARALGDPTLEVGYRLPNGGDFVDAEGRPFDLPDRGSARSVTMIEAEGRPIAALVHDPAVLEDPGLRDAVASAARLAAANARLQAEVRAQIAELRASRRRLVEAGDAERQRLELRLREGAQHRLQRLAEQLRRIRLSAASDTAAERIDRADAQLALALEELRRLAHGLHPRVLSEAGLAGALASLAEQTPMPVEVLAPAARLPAEVEAATYFFCSEALANIAKHASATRVSVCVTTSDERVRIEVVDDGRGGADPTSGTGLRGLADRVEALGGTLHLESPTGAGTRLAAEIPLGREAPFGLPRVSPP
jgi:signal transduction histidine kinase